MNLLNKLQAESNKMANTKEEIVTEIKDSFSKYLNEKLENFLERNINDKAKQERKYKLTYDFWEYVPGCTKTRFYIAGWEWCNKEVPDYSVEQDYYKGFRLHDIQDIIIEQLIPILINFLKVNGFHCENYRERDRFNNIKGEVVISW